MSTAARIFESSAAHYYDKQGNPCHFVEKKDGSGLRPAHLGDARKNGWLPSPTTILKALAKPAIVAYQIEQACLAVLTCPRQEGEDLDAFVKRVLQDERHQDEHRKAAAELGSNIHKALQHRLSCLPYELEMDPYILPVVDAFQSYGRPVALEKVVIGNGYAGTMDCLLEGQDIWVMDFKTTGAEVLPKKPYKEHSYQVSAYAGTLGNTGDKVIRCAVCYISTKRPGEFVILESEYWHIDLGCFKALLAFWCLDNGHDPRLH